MESVLPPWDLTVVEAPDALAVSLEDAKAHLRVEHDADDDLITGYIEAATKLAEDVYTWRAFVTRTYTVRMSATSPVWLPYPPVQAIVSVTLLDANGAPDQVLTESEYSLRPSSGIVLLGSRSNPKRECEIEYVAGYGDDDTDVPTQFKQGILLLVGHWYENREAAVIAAGAAAVEAPLGVERLLLSYRAERPD